MNENQKRSTPPGAVVLAGRSVELWQLALGAQRTAVPDHSEWYALVGSMVETLQLLSSLSVALVMQVGAYPVGRVLRDDEPGADPMWRIAGVQRGLHETRNLLVDAEQAANRVWGQIGHIGVEAGDR